MMAPALIPDNLHFYKAPQIPWNPNLVKHNQSEKYMAKYITIDS